MRIGSPPTPVVAARFRWGVHELTLISAPDHSPDWVSAVLTARRGLRRCAEMRFDHDDAYVTAPLEAFDRGGTQVRYELPLDGIVRAAAASRTTVNVCGQQLELDGFQLAELRRMVLLTLYRRSQVAPALSLPALSAAGAAADAEPLRAQITLTSITKLTIRYAIEHPDRVELHFETRGPGRYGSCDVRLEAGPAALTATRRDVAEDQRAMTWSIDDMDGFFALGVVDHARLEYCNSAVNLARYAGGLRRFVLLALLQRGRAGAHGAGVDLPPAQQSEESFALPRRRDPAPEHAIEPGAPSDDGMAQDPDDVGGAI